MKAKFNRQKSELPLNTDGVPAAYDLKVERLECKRRALQSKIGIAWLEGDRVQGAPITGFSEEMERHVKRNSMFRKWLNESCLPIDTAELEQSLLKAPTASAGFIRCVLVSSGASWEIWKYMCVCEALMNPPGSKGPRRAFIPSEFTIFDPDRAANVWRVQHEDSHLERCLQFGRQLFFEAARLYELGCHLIEGFEEEFSQPYSKTYPSGASQPVSHIKDCVEAIKNMIYTVRMNETQDLAVALRQGFLIGRWLTRAESMISGDKAMQVASRQGISGQRTSNLYGWVMAQAAFDGKSLDQIFDALNDKFDPRYQGKMKVVGDTLIRGNGKALSLVGFKTGLSRARSRQRVKKN